MELLTKAKEEDSALEKSAGEIWLPPFMRNLVVIIRRES